MKTSITLNTGAEMPLLGFGTWKLKGEEAYSATLAAIKAGYRHIDTAAIYGNEEEVGRAIIDSQVPREELFVTTKLWNDDQSDPESALQASLDKLQLEYVDLYLIHWPAPTRVDAYKVLEELHSQGKAKAIGVSNFTEKHLDELLSQTEIIPAVNQVEFNPFLNQADLASYCRDKNIILEAYCPLARGIKLEDERLLSIAEKYGKTPAQIMLRWAVQQDIVAIPKSSHEQRIQENFNIFDFNISDEDMAELGSWNEDVRSCPNPYKML